MTEDRELITLKLKWLETVALDPRLRGYALVKDIAILYALRYYNIGTGDGWVGTRRLAERLGADRRNVRLALKALVACKWLVLEKRGKAGARRGSNRYALNFDQLLSAARPARQGAVEPPVQGAVEPPVTGGCRTPLSRKSNTRERQPVSKQAGGRAGSPRFDAPSKAGLKSSSPRKEDTSSSSPSKAKPAAPSKQKTKSAASKSRKTPPVPFPSNWKFGDAEAEVAQRICGWSRDKAAFEFNKFTQRAQSWKRVTDWSLQWENWCWRDHSREEDNGAAARKSNGHAKPPPFMQGLAGAWDEQEEREKFMRDE
jgi:hypothetical protein